MRSNKLRKKKKERRHWRVWNKGVNPLGCCDYLITTHFLFLFLFELLMKINLSDTLKSTRRQNNWQIHQLWRWRCLHWYSQLQWFFWNMLSSLITTYWAFFGCEKQEVGNLHVFIEKQILSLSKNLEAAAGKTKAEFEMWLIWFLPYRPKLLISTSFPRKQFVLLLCAFTWGKLGVSAENKKEGSLLERRPGARGNNVHVLQGKKGHQDSIGQNGHVCSLVFLSMYLSFSPPK